MSEHKFTTGPWIARKVGGQVFPGQVGYAIDFNEDQEQVVDFVYEEADARLIAAAPDLLAELERLAGIIDKMGDMADGFIHPRPWRELGCEEALTSARSVIAKALGSQ